MLVSPIDLDGQGHGDRLSAVDATFLAQESATSHMQVGAVLVFEGPAPSYAELCRHMHRRLHLAPRYRQRLAFAPLDGGRPVWVDDAAFHLDYHVRCYALPEPRSDAELLALAARLHSEPLSRASPLWRLSLVDGLVGNRFAIVAQVHHALADGVGCAQLAGLILDCAPVAEAGIPEADEWTPRPAPTRQELLTRGMRGLGRASCAIPGAALGAVARPAATIGRARDAAEGLTEVVRACLNPAPRTPLNVPIGPHRRIAVVRSELADFARIKDALGGTVNDVLLATIAGGLHSWLSGRGVRTEELELQALVPVSIRRSTDVFGNHLALMRGPLPVHEPRPAARLRALRDATARLKASKQVAAAQLLATAQGVAPPALLAQASRLTFSTRLFNLLVTNVPGPQQPLFLLGRELREALPVAFLPRNHALSVAALSYNGHMSVGLLGDRDAMPDLDALAGATADALAALLDAAQARRARPARRSPHADSVGR